MPKLRTTVSTWHSHDIRGLVNTTIFCDIPCLTICMRTTAFISVLQNRRRNSGLASFWFYYTKSENRCGTIRSDNGCLFVTNFSNDRHMILQKNINTIFFCWEGQRSGYGTLGEGLRWFRGCIGPRKAVVVEG